MPRPAGSAARAASARLRAARPVRKRGTPQRYPNILDANSRIEALRSLLAQSPDNCFARYGQAMEEFAAIVAKDPSYSAAYFHGGQTLEKMGRIEEAREYYRRGIDHAADPHARSELQGALDILGE